MFIRRFMQVGVLIFITTVLALSAQAATNASLKGSYSFLSNRWTANVNTSQFARVGIWTFDGAGNWTESYTAMAGSHVTTGNEVGTYTVKSNGTGTISASSGTQLAITLNSTAAGVAHGVQFLVTNDTSNEVESGAAVLQSTAAGNYSVASLEGKFGYQWNEWTADVTAPQEGNIGVVSFDGKGNVNVSDIDVDDGAVRKGTLTGTYAVNSDGSGSIVLNSKNGSSQFALVLNSVAAGQAKGLQFLQTSTTRNVVVSGTALKQ